MTAVSAQEVKALREKTGLPMMACKKALEAVGGDMDQAVNHLRASGAAVAAKKSTRPTGDGAIGARVYDQTRSVQLGHGRAAPARRSGTGTPRAARRRRGGAGAGTGPQGRAGKRAGM